MPYGYTGRILHVNLTDGSTSIENPPDDFYRRYLGGNGFIGYYLLREIPAHADPLGPENVLVFAGGPITGVPVAGGGRSHVGAKSPLTGGYGEADTGGHFGAELKRAGFDALIVHGRAPEPVYLWLHDGEAEIHPAGHLWGMQTLACQEAVLEELGERRARMALIGPAGEKLARIACIINDLHDAAGRTGLGAVMGSKNLKAVVARGKRQVELADPQGLRELAHWMRDHWQEDAASMHDYGTAGGLEDLNEFGALPTRNFQDGRFEGASKISGQTMAKTILTGTDGCYACPIHCKRVVEIHDEEYDVRPEYGGPEYETIGAVGSNCGVDDLRAVSKASELCNAYGIDTIAGGMMVSFAMECYEAGLLTKEDTGGLDLRFGNAPAMVEMIRRIGEREGLGDLLAEGPLRAAAKIGRGAEKYAIQVKGQPFPMHECRNRHGQALGYAVSPTGADHMHNFWDSGLEKSPVGADLQGWGVYTAVPQNVLNADKVRAFTPVVNWAWLDNHLGMCMFIPWSIEQKVQLVRAITGWKTNVFELQLMARRGVTLARAFNVREGFTRADDRLPDRMNEPHKSRTTNERPVDPEVLDENLSTYYNMMGWDAETGIPTLAGLRELDIEWVAGHLPKA